MSKEEQSLPVEAAQERIRIANNGRLLEGEEFEIDINTLIGASGERLTATDGDWDFRPDPDYEPEEGEDAYFTPRNGAWCDSTYFGSETSSFNCEHDAHPDEFPDRYAEGAERIIGALATHMSADVRDDLKQAVSELREPLRVVAVHRFYRGLDHEAVARRLNTSVETIEFLSQLVLDQLALRVDISIR